MCSMTSGSRGLRGHPAPDTASLSVPALLSVLGCRSEECEGISDFLPSCFHNAWLRKLQKVKLCPCPILCSLSHCPRLALPLLPPRLPGSRGGWEGCASLTPHSHAEGLRWRRQRERREIGGPFFEMHQDWFKTSGYVARTNWDVLPQGMASCMCGTCWPLCRAGELPLALPTWLRSVIWATPKVRKFLSSHRVSFIGGLFLLWSWYFFFLLRSLTLL